MPIQLVAPDTLTNTSTSGSQVEVAVQALSDGRTLFSWQSNDGGESGSGFLASGIRARIQNADGSWAGPDFYLNGTTAGAQSAPALVDAANGTFASVWQSDDGADASGSLIRFRLHTASGAGVATDIVVNTTGTAAQSAPAVAALTDGSFLVTWQSADTSGSDNDGGCIRSRLISSTGSPIGIDLVVNSTVTGTQTAPSVTHLGNGGYVIAWTSADAGDGSANCIRARVYNADGIALGSDFIVNASTNSTQTKVKLVATETGFLAVWESNDGGEGVFQGTAVRARFFTDSGASAGLDFIVNSTTTSLQGSPSVTALPDGRFFVVWQSEDPGDSEGNCIRGRMLSSDGALLDKDFVINTTGKSVQYAPSVTATTDGRISIGWVSYDGADGSPPLIRSVNYDALTYNGDATSNTWRGGSFNDKISGKIGNDFLYGFGGNDKLYGNEEDDILFGGAGKDLIDGGSGIDTASYLKDAAVVVALDKSIAFAGAALGDTLVAIENLEGSIAGNDTLIGNGLRNFIFARGGHDKVTGRAGNDLLDGGSGSDILNGGAGRDQLVGGTGTDTVTYQDDTAVMTSLDGSVRKTGAALGDTYSSIESLIGSAKGSDTLTGNSLANRLTGLGGNDKLNGQSGNDVLYGGRGTDTLKGGKGADKFAFAARDEGGDAIRDYDSTDTFTFKSETFGNLDRGRIDSIYFQLGTTNIAKSNDTHFIFETDARILWFDSNGNDAGGLLKIATLGGTVSVTASDIVIV